MKSKFSFGLRDVLYILFGLVPTMIAFIYYDDLPQQMANHFGTDGEPDGYMSKNIFILVIGLFTAGMPLIFKLTRLIDPKRNNYEKFNDTFELIRLLFSVLLNVTAIIVIFYNLGYPIRMNVWVFIILGLFFILLGNVLGRIRFNYFIGIRTPWTLANEEVWRRTHRFAGPIYMVGGAFMLVSLLVEKPFW